ncbi:MAG: hypothetical protein GEU97_17860 [Actinophytocola sp.]|nr:hypothetical protein [Actinophytocola sp.]
MGVDQPRQQRRTGKVDDVGLIGRGELARAVDRGDGVPVDDEHRVLDHVGAVDEAVGADDRELAPVGGRCRRQRRHGEPLVVGPVMVGACGQGPFKVR